MDMSVQNRISSWVADNRDSVKQAVVVGIATVSCAANAAIDLSSVTSTITDGVTAAGVIGLAFLGFKMGIAIFKNLRGAA